jgi:hypothetical protein
MNSRARKEGVMARLRYKGGERVKGGNYWNYDTGERVTVGADGILPGDSAATYVKVHPALVLMAGPFLGLLYAAFLPFIGIAMVMKVMASRLFGGVRKEAPKVATFDWRPTEAYLAGKKHRSKEKKDEPGTEKEEEKSK